MKTLDEIRAFWEALPGSLDFNNSYGPAILEVERTDALAVAAETAALQARARHRRAVAEVRQLVEADADAEWHAEDIAAARGAALRTALELAAMPAS